MPQPIEFEARISDRGAVEPTGPRAARIVAKLQTYRGRQALVTVEPERKQRSLAQNRRYWCSIVPFAREILSVTRDVPLSKDQAHYVLKSAFLGVIDTTLGPVPKSTTRLSTAEFATYCERIEAHFNQIGHYLPAEWEDA